MKISSPILFILIISISLNLNSLLGLIICDVVVVDEFGALDDAANVVASVDDVVGPVDAAADVGAVGPVDAAADVGAVGTVVAAGKLPKTKIV